MHFFLDYILIRAYEVNFCLVSLYAILINLSPALF